MERTKEDFQLEGLKVLPLQDVEQIGADTLNDEKPPARLGSRGRVLREPCANLVLAQVGRETRAKILRCVSVLKRLLCLEAREAGSKENMLALWWPEMRAKC